MRGLIFIIGLLLSAFGLGAQGIESFPLVSLSERGVGEPLFTELDADAIGVGDFVNNYSGSDVWTKRWREYILGTIGTGVTLGDIDGDRLPDLFIASKDEKSRLYRNLGGMNFLDISDESGFVDSPDPASGCGFVDVDSDGDLDLYVCYVNGKNQLWINDGAGYFSEEAEAWGVAIRSGCTMASFSDYDRDGDMDFYLQNNMLHFEDKYEKLEDRLFENVGGRFVEVTEKSGISGKGHGHSAIWWDYNEDGWPDIYVANDFDDLDKLYRNNGDGTFTDVISNFVPQAPYYSMGADFGDINNDGHSDFFVADMAATTREQHLRTVGNHEHVYKINPKSETYQSLKNALLLKLSNDHFAEIAFLAGLAGTDWTWAARLVDLNNDGLLDAFVSNGMLRSFHDGDMGKKQIGSVSDAWMATAFRNEPILKERNLAYENTGNLGFENKETDWGLGKLGVSFGAAFGDLDGDGDLDLVTNNYQDKVSVFQNNESSGNRITIRLKGSESNAYGVGAKLTVATGKLKQVKELSLMRGYMSVDEPVLHFGLGQANVVELLEVLWPSGNRQVFQDLAVNRHYVIEEEMTADLPLSQKGTQTLFSLSEIRLPEEAIRKESYYSDFKRQKLLPFPESRLTGSVALGDLNGDDCLDIVLGGAFGQESLSLLNEGDGAFEATYSLDFEADFGSEDWDLKLIDWDEDGDLDLLVASGGVESEEGDSFYADRLYLNDGQGDFLREWEVAFSEEYNSTSVIAPADFDGDGDLDLFIGGKTIPHKYPYAAPSSLWRNDNGKYSKIGDDITSGISNVGRVSAASWVDIDNDKDLDLVVAREWGVVSVFRNENGVFAEDSIGGDAGLWSSMAVEDLDGNGRLDIIVGNLGLNTEYRASQDKPMRLWYSSSSDGKVKLVETLFDNEGEWTREVKWRLDKVFPREMRRIRSFTQYVEMTFDEIFPNIEEQGYSFKDISELRSGIFWQDTDGTFSFEALPAFAQSGRAMALLVEDFDEDGAKDIMISLELPTPEPWSGRFEKGHLGLFLNRGGRDFETTLAWESGLVINGSPRALAYGDLDGDGREEVLVVLNEGMPLIFSKAK